MTSIASGGIVYTGINSVGCAGRVRTGTRDELRVVVVSVKASFIGHAGCGRGVAGRNI